MAGFSLQVVVPLLVSEDEQALVTCISCLTKVHPFFPCSLKCDKKLFQFKVVTKKKEHFAVDLHESFYYCVYVHILTSSSVPSVLVSCKQNFLIF